MAESRTRSKSVYHWPAHGWSTHSGAYAYPESNEHLHTCVDATHPGPPYKSGGPLYISKFERLGKPLTQPQVVVFNPWPSLKHELGFDNLVAHFRVDPTLPWNFSSSFSDTELIAWGTEGWRKCSANKPHMDLNQTIAELHDIRRLGREVVRQYREIFGSRRTLRELMQDIASGNLSYQFAIKPLIDDWINFQELETFLRKRTEHIRKTNGKTRHCSKILFEKEDSYYWEGVTQQQYWEPGLPAYWFLKDDGRNMPRSEKVTHRRKVWIEGRFGAYIPIQGMPDWERKLRLTQGLGINLSGLGVLRTLYQLTPWSWLFDWAVSTGDILANAVAVNDRGAFSKYAYVMATDEWILHSHQSLIAKNGAFNHVVQGDYRSTHKHRIEASPFGFGIKSPEFNDWQTAILISLGMTRM